MFYWITITILNKYDLCPKWFYLFSQFNYGQSLMITYLQALYMLRVIHFISIEWDTVTVNLDTDYDDNEFMLDGQNAIDSRDNLDYLINELESEDLNFDIN